MNIFEYVAVNNPEGAREVLNSFGEKAIRRPELLARQLANSVNRNGKDALYRIAAVHPDYNLVSEYAMENNKRNQKKLETESIFSSAEGQELKRTVESIKDAQNKAQPKEESRSESKDLLIIGSVVVLALALVMNK